MLAELGNPLQKDLYLLLENIFLVLVFSDNLEKNVSIMIIHSNVQEPAFNREACTKVK